MGSEVGQLHFQAESLAAEFKQGGESSGIEEAIVLDREALERCPHGHPKRAVHLTWLSIHLDVRYSRLGEMKDIEEAIVLDREALDLRPSGHPYRSVSLNNLAARLYTRYNWNGVTLDLDEGILLAREALHLCTAGHPDRSISLNNVALYLSTRYNQNGETQDLNDAIVLGRDALHLCTPGHPNRSVFLSNLASRLSTRYDRNGATQDLDEAIVFGREALHLCPASHPGRSMSLNNLAVDLFSRYHRHRATQDLDEAIFLNQEALQLRPAGHPLRSSSLSNLAANLSTRYDQDRKTEDLDEAIILGREALHLCPADHPFRSLSLDNLACYLSARYNAKEATQDLHEAIVLGRKALHLRLPGHPLRSSSLINVARYLSTLYSWNGTSHDLDEAIILAREALQLCPPGHPDRSISLNNLAGYISDRFRQSEQLEDKEEVFSLYAQLADVTQFVSSPDLSAAKNWTSTAEDFQHSSLLLAHETSLRLLVQHLATLPSLPQHLDILKDLTSSLAVDAFSAFLRHGSLEKAVELLEQGRGVFWNQLTRLSYPLDDVIASGPAGRSLADDFSRLASLTRDALGSIGPDQHERVYCLNVEMENVVTKIRELPGLSRFLLPSPFSDLQSAAKEGPVVVVNASKHGCDALVIFLDRDPVRIPLQITRKCARELAAEFHSLTRIATKADMTKQLAVFLRKLWDQIVSPIVNFLGTTLAPHSRIWWCPTAEFSLLPLHAAGPYRTGGRKLADIYISSYTPTLTALIRARRSTPSHLSTERKERFVAVGQANAVGTRELLSVGAELDDVGKRIDGLATFTRICGRESSIARVVEELGRNEWIHLACHGIPNRRRPFESAFALRDGHLKVQRIIGCELQNPEFAYLSACHTTVGYEESPDEAIHLAAAMQFIGFRSVIGTIWAVDDGETNKITSTFYRHMVDKSGRLDHTRAAYALNKTMRSIHIPLDQRILYIHLGA